MRSKLLAVVLLAFLPMDGMFSQDVDLKQTFLEAESYFLFEEYNEALPLYLRLHRADRENDDINYKIGVCFLNDPYQKEKSIRYLEQASGNVNPKYKENNFKERTAPLETFFYLGNAYLVNNQIDKALENYQHFLEILDPDVYDVELVEAQIRVCKRAMELQKKPVDYDLVNLGERINGRFTDINPVLSGDGNSLVYVSERQFYDASFYAEKVNGEWQTPRNIIPELGVDGDVYPTGLSYDGKTMIIYRNDEFVGNLYVSYLQDGKWTAMEKLGDNINTKFWESHGSLSQDGNTLYFTSNRKGGYGGLDIYRSEKLPDGTWGEPLNLGPRINSRYNEDTPFLTENGKRIYFSSFGHFNIGGYDIFYSQVDENGEWGEPINIGYPINTTDDDLFFLPLNNGNSGMISKYLPGGYGRHDLYYAEIYSENNPRMYLITGTFNTERGLVTRDDEMKVYLVDAEAGDTLIIMNPNLDLQSFEMKVPRGDFNVIIRSETYKEIENRVSINDSTDKTGIDISARLHLEEKPYLPKIFTGEDSRIGLDKDTITDVHPGEEFSVNLNLRRNAILYVDMYYDSLLVKSDTLEIARRRYSYAFIPGDNNTILDFKLEESNGDISQSRLVVISGETEPELVDVDTIEFVDIEKDTLQGQIDTVFEEDAGIEMPVVIKQEDDQDEQFEPVREMIRLYSQYADDSLRMILQTIDPIKEGITTRQGLRGFLIKEKGVDPSVLDAIEIYEALDNDGETMLSYMIDHSSGELRKYLEDLDLEKAGINSAEELVIHLKEVAGNEGFSSEEVINVVALMKMKDNSAEKTRRELLSVADGDLKDYLSGIDLDKENINSGEELLIHLRNVSGEESFTVEEVESLILKENLKDIQVVDIMDDYIGLADGDLKSYLENLDAEKHSIKSALDLINHLMSIAGEESFSLEEINTLVANEQIIELSAGETRDYLLSVGSEDLVEYLNEIDLEEHNLYSSAQLIEHLRSVAGKEPFSVEEVENLVSDQLVYDMSADELKQYLIETGSDVLAGYLDKLDLEQNNISSATQLTFHLRKAAGEELFSDDQINHLLMVEMFKDFSSMNLRESFLENAQGDLREYLLSLDMEGEGIDSGIDLARHLLEVAGQESFSKSEVSDLLTNHIVKDLTVEETINILSATSDSELKEYIDQLDLKNAKINSSVKLMKHLREVSEEVGFESEEVNRAAAIGNVRHLDSEQALQALLMIADGDMKQYLENLDLQEKNINNGGELVDYLIEISKKQAFSVEDVNELITKIHQDEISAEHARLLLLEDAEGKLYLLLNDLDFDRKGILTKADILLYLAEEAGDEQIIDELYRALPALFSENKTPSLFIDYLVRQSPARLSRFLMELDPDLEFETIEQLFSFLAEHAEEIGMSREDLQKFVIDRAGEFLTTPVGKLDTITVPGSQRTGWRIGLALIASGIMFYILILFRRRKKKKQE